MDTTKFVELVRNIIIENSNLKYKELLDTTDDAEDSTWIGILPIYRALTDSQKKDFLKFIRLISVNTVSQIFGVLDGSSYFSEDKVQFNLTSNINEFEKINGDLLDIFWEMEEKK